MSFEKMQDIQQNTHERSCMLLYGFTMAELKQIQSVARMTGLKDQVILKPEHITCTIKQILDNELTEVSGDLVKEKTIIFNQTPTMRMNAFIEGLKKCRMSRPLIAVVTETSINWTLKELIENLQAERQALRNNQFNTPH